MLHGAAETSRQLNQYRNLSRGRLIARSRRHRFPGNHEIDTLVRRTNAEISVEVCAVDYVRGACV